MAFVNVEDLRRRARRNLPRAVFDFIDGAAEDEVSLRLNRTALERITFRPRVPTLLFLLAWDFAQPVEDRVERHTDARHTDHIPGQAWLARTRRPDLDHWRGVIGDVDDPDERGAGPQVGRQFDGDVGRVRRIR